MKFLLLVAVSAFGVSASALAADTFTLYRNSAIDASMRIHMATFDAKNDGSYNRDNCNIAAGLFQNQPGVKTRYWCEKGSFKE